MNIKLTAEQLEARKSEAKQEGRREILNLVLDVFDLQETYTVKELSLIGEAAVRSPWLLYEDLKTLTGEKSADEARKRLKKILKPKKS